MRISDWSSDVCSSDLRSDGGALVGAAGDADHSRTEDLADLSGERADRAGCCRDHHRFAGRNTADADHAGVRGLPGHAEHTERGRQRCDAWIDLAQWHALRIDRRVFAPAGAALDKFAALEIRMRSEEHTSELQSLMRIS